MKYEKPHVLPVSEIRDEAQGIKTLFFDAKLPALPGQFVMVWVPGLDMKPFGIGYLEEKRFGVTISAVGKTSNALCSAKKGELLGIMGPYGRAFELEGRRIMIIGGGYGAATVFPLARQAKKEGLTQTLVIGARTRDVLLYVERAKKSGINTVFTTDDGSFGRKGYATEVLEEALKAGGLDMVYACGPELMLKKIQELCRRYRTKCQLSIERYMKCGFGMCGSCSVDGTGKRVCVEGTVVSGEEAQQITELGKYHRDASGTRHEF